MTDLDPTNAVPAASASGPLLADRSRPWPVAPLVRILVVALALIGGPAAVAAAADPVPAGPRSAPSAAGPTADRSPFGDGPDVVRSEHAEVGAQVPTSSASPVAAGAADPGTSDNTPQPVGRPYPPAGQRVADSLIAVWVLVMLGGGIALGWYLSWKSGRRPGPDPSAAPVAAGDPGADPVPPSR